MTRSSPPSVTLTEVLHLALPSGSSVLCGEMDLDRRVHWARLLRARPTGLGVVEPGELLILPPGLIESPGDPRVLARLIGELLDAGVAAFVVFEDPKDIVVQACASSGTPVLRVPAGSQLAEVERSIIGLILDRDAQLRRRVDEIYSGLLATMLGNAGLPALVEALAEATGLRTAVFDDYLALQAASATDESYDQALVAAAGSLMLRESGAATARHTRPLPLRVDHDGVIWSGQLYPLQIGSTWAGYLALVGRPGQAGELDRLVADRATTLVALELAKQRAVAEATQRWRGEFLDDLLEGNFPTDEAALARASQLGHDLLRPHICLVLGLDVQPEDVEATDVPVTAVRQRRRFAEVARNAVLRHEPRSLTVERDGALVALIPSSQAGDPTAAALQVEELRAALAEAPAGVEVSAGIGRAVLQPRDFTHSYCEAAQALSIGQRLLGGGRTVHYGRLGIERLLYHLLGRPELEQFALEMLSDLMTYDSLHRGDLVRTLETFLRCNGNHVRAAQELHLHRNTLLYRLERTREILGRDLEDAETRLALQVALRIRGAIRNQAAEGRAGRRVAGRRRRAG